MGERQAKVSLPVGVTKGFGKNGHYTLSLGPVAGYGRTLSEAREDLTSNIMSALTKAMTKPAFARDDDGSLVVAIPDITGVSHWVVRDDKPREITYTDGTPSDSLRTVPHYTLL